MKLLMLQIGKFGLLISKAFIITLVINIILSLYVSAIGMTLDDEIIKDSFNSQWALITVLLMVNEVIIEIRKEIEK